MIGKQIKGVDFKKLLKYLAEKEGAIQLGGNMIGHDPQILTREFQFTCRLNPQVKRPVYHASLSLAPDEFLEDRVHLETEQKTTLRLKALRSNDSSRCF